MKVAATKTEGEVLFERYLKEHSLKFEFHKRFLKKKKKPDYTIPCCGQEFLFDVKDFAPKEFPKHGGSYDPIGPIRRKIDAGQEKFQEFKEYACGLILYNEGAPLVHLSEPMMVFGAMFGNPGFTTPIDTRTGGPAGPTLATLLDGGKLIHSRKRKPRIEQLSALVTLRKIRVGSLRLQRYVDTLPKNLDKSRDERFAVLWDHLESVELPFDTGEEVLGVIVWENVQATRHLPAELFRGEFDERWTLDNSGFHLAYRGAELQKVIPAERQKTFFDNRSESTSHEAT